MFGRRVLDEAMGLTKLETLLRSLAQVNGASYLDSVLD